MRKNKMIAGVVGAALSLTAPITQALSSAGVLVVSTQPERRRSKDGYVLTKTKDPFPHAYPSTRKGKGEKKRAAHSRRMKGWA